MTNLLKTNLTADQLERCTRAVYSKVGEQIGLLYDIGSWNETDLTNLICKNMKYQGIAHKS